MRVYVTWPLWNWDRRRNLDNAKSIDRLSDVALAYVLIGAHYVAPSDTNDGIVRAVKYKLIEAGLAHRAGEAIVISYFVPEFLEWVYDKLRYSYSATI